MNQNRLLEFKQFNFDLMGYVPNETQIPVHDSTASVLLVNGGEGSGKSFVTSAEVASRYGRWKRVLFAAYKAESASNESDYLYDLLNRIGAVVNYSKPKTGNIEIKCKNGAIVESVTTHAEAERAISGTGKSYDIIAMLEAGKQKYSVFLACLLRISRTGGLLILSGTVEQSEVWYPDLIRKLQEDEQRRKDMNAQVVILPTWGNKKLYPLGRDDPKIKLLEKELTPELFAERLAGIPSPPEGLVIKGFSYLTHVFEWVKFNPKYPVEVAIDPGWSGSHYSVSFIQEFPRIYTRQFYPELPDSNRMDVFVIADLYLNYTTHEDIIEVAKNLECWQNVSGGVGDVIMKTHPQADRAPIDVWKEKGGIFLRAQPVSVDDNVDRHKTFIKDPATMGHDPITHLPDYNTGYPRIFFNPSCKGIVEYGLWKKKVVGEGLYGKPDDKYCDFTKAIGYYLIDRFGRVEKMVRDNNVAMGNRVTLEQSKTQLPATLDSVHTRPQLGRRNQSASYVVSGSRKANRIG